MKIGIPSYIFPDAILWPRIIALKPALVVLNPRSGPGLTINPHYAALARTLEREKITALGYISTGWAEPHPSDRGKPIWEVDQERNRYLEFYPSIDGFFYDEAATQPERIFYYRALWKWSSKGMAAMAINPGTFPDPSYLSVPAIKMVYETDMASYLAAEPPKWVTDDQRASTEHFWHCVYGVPTERDAIRVAAAAKRRRAGYVWITNGVQPNPYNVLPPYFESLPDILAA